MSRPAALAKLLYYPTQNEHARDLGRISRGLFQGVSRRAWVMDPSAGEGAALSAFVDGLREKNTREGVNPPCVEVPVVSALELDVARFGLLRGRTTDFQAQGIDFLPAQGDQFSSSFGSLEDYNNYESVHPTVLFTNPPYHTDTAYERMEVRFTIDALKRYMNFRTESWRRPTSVHAWSIIPEDSLPLLQKHLKDTNFFAVLAFRFRPEEYALWRQVAVLILPVCYVGNRGGHRWGFSEPAKLRTTAAEVYDWSYAASCADGTSDIQSMITDTLGEISCALTDNPFTQNEAPDYQARNDAARYCGIPGLENQYDDASPKEADIRRALCSITTIPLSSDDYTAIDAANPLLSGRGAAVMLPSTAHNFGRPLIPLASGHLALVAAAGVIDGATVVDATLKGHARPWRIKGLAARSTRTWSDINESGTEVKVSREVINVTFTLFCPTTREVISWTAEDNLDEINAFLARNAEQIRAAIELQIPARLSEAEARGIKIKARAPAGKSPWGAQLRTIAGALEGLKDGNVIVCGEQGTGKTFMLSAIARQVAHTIKRGYAWIRPVVVMCPGHLVEKWAAEWRDVTGLPATIAQTHEDVLSYAEAFRAWSGTTPVPPAFLGASWGFYSGVQRPWVVSRLQGTLPTSAKAHPGLLIVSKETAKLGSPWRWAVDTRTVRLKNGTTRTRVLCPTCGMDVEEIVLDRARMVDTELTKLPMAEWPTPAAKPVCRVTKGTEMGEQVVGCGAALWRATRMDARTKLGKARAPLAYTIARKLHGYVLILDECQDYTAKTADQSHAANRLATHAWRTIPATGTLTDGLASTLFYLLYWTQPKFREDWKFGEVERFVATHGIVERVTTISQSDGAMGGRRGDSTTRVTEVPGVDPTLFKYLLGSTVFMRLEDVKPEFEAMGRTFPKYEESVEILPCPSDLASAANADANDARSLRFKEPSEAAKLWARSLYGPNSLDASHPVTPKERRMLELVREQLARGGKVAIYVTYINKSRTMPRLKGLLEKEGIRVTTLEQSDSPSTRAREAVLKDKIAQADVLITNGTLVQTGLDLLWATLIIQFGAELKTRTLSQQIRRAMRINQPDPLVRVVILSHQGVPEESYTQYVARKIQAAAVMQNSILDGLAGASESKGYELIQTFRNTFGAD